ncbi:MAG: VCBS repeat-containing protein, partial [Saprospiraceae bacterium]|nr:VCBS repeat-containing protein [Saprospiraceae bacterium]
GRLPINLSEPLFHEVAETQSIAYGHLENNFDDYSKQVLLPHKMSTMGPHISTGDINGDGLDDIFIGGAAGQSGQFFVQTVNSTFTKITSSALGSDSDKEDMGSVLFDADGDNDLDIYVVSGGNEWQKGSENYQDRLYINDGRGNFVTGQDRLPSISSSGSQVRPCDYDKDGDIDLFVAGRHQAWTYPEPASSSILRNQDGYFEDVTSEIAPDLVNLGMVNDVRWFDYNSDGTEDLVLVGEWMPVTIFTNTANGFVKYDGSDALNQKVGWFFSVETADMDGDGDEDILAGNLGLNYKYKASDTEPFEVYYYDFDENGSKDVVLTYYNFGVQYPLRGRECSSQQVPVIKDRFKNYDLFASSDVFQVYGESKLENALHLAATDFASLYIENQGNGKFEIRPLPLQAQISSINDFIIEDINQDGHQDVVLAGNLFDAEVETARADASYGLVMIGDGQGDFRTLTKRESGLFVPYNVKSLATVRTTAGRMLLVGRNNGALKAYHF